jgi:hypothetical protein
MTHLPVDLAQWPEDPFAVLGVDRRADETELRRAYARLIRVYKPEHAPEEFRRVREAYDQAQQQLEQRRRWGDDDEPSSSDHAAPPANGERVATRDVDDTVPVGPLQHDTWRALAGVKLLDEYRRLAQQSERSPDETTFVQLYWLLKLHSDFDAREPVEWLVRWLRSYPQLDGPAWDLYYAHIFEHPAEALTERFQSLLDHAERLDRLTGLLSIRWESCGRLGEYRPIVADLEKYRSRFALHDQDRWGQLLASAMFTLGWLDESEADDKGRELFAEIERFYAVSPQHHGLFDQAEEVAIGIDSWKQMRTEGNVSQSLIELIQRSKRHPFLQIRPQLEAFLERRARSPGQLLDDLSNLYKLPAMLFEFGRLLRILEVERERSFSGAWEGVDAKRWICDRLDETLHQTYSNDLRRELLHFCCVNHLPPEIIRDQVGEDPEYFLEGEPLAAWLDRDWPLRFTCWAYRLTE